MLRNRSFGRRWLSILAVAVLLAAGCSDSDDDGTSTTTIARPQGTDAGAQTTADAGGSAGSASGISELSEDDFAFCSFWVQDKLWESDQHPFTMLEALNVLPTTPAAVAEPLRTVKIGWEAGSDDSPTEDGTDTEFELARLQIDEWAIANCDFPVIEAELADGEIVGLPAEVATGPAVITVTEPDGGGVLVVLSRAVADGTGNEMLSFNAPGASDNNSLLAMLEPGDYTVGATATDDARTVDGPPDVTANLFVP
ncbi:MAG: hypothetical protein KAZ88_10325 [Acidimicrobiia bacterium]|nr:hypothetical protein [Acidimicrobiia bacterium]MBP8181374.1 hypothetical protein [Acidimicrobiia bacterium]